LRHLLKRTDQALTRADLWIRALARQDAAGSPDALLGEAQVRRLAEGLTRPKPAPKDRSNFERHIYSVEAAVTDVLQEADKDLHVVLEDGPAHMVAESPNAPFCSVDATVYRKKQMANARDKVRICAHARIVGFVFWDRPHNVTGRAPNSIELHPILDFACLS
jgi:hypothetical protein